jgi:hypothetical protein
MSVVFKGSTFTGARVGRKSPAFQILVKTDNAGTSNSDQFTFPATAGTYDIDWGDGSSDTGVSGSQTHTYASAGEYVIKVTGGLTALAFNNGGDKLKLLELQNWGDIVWSTFSLAFYGCSNLQITATDLPNSGAVTNFTAAWLGCSSLTSFPLIDTSSGTIFTNAWNGCSSLTSFPPIDTSNGVSFYNAWRACSSLTSFPLINTSKVTDFYAAWLGCSSLTSFPLIDTSSGTSFGSAWQNCSSLTSFPLLDTSNATNFYGTWQDCSSLASFPQINTGNVGDFRYAWLRCSSLTSFPLIDISGVQVTYGLNNAWHLCTGLTSFPLLDTSNVESFHYTWANCTSLVSFPLLSFASMTNGSYCFNGVTLPTETWSNLLIATEAVNNNASVTWHGGNSKYNVAGGVARQALIDDHAWVITDGGAE